MAGSLQAHEQSGLKKRRWTPKEDQKLMRYMKDRRGHDKPVQWKEVPKLAMLNKSRKSCWLRWTKYLRPGIKRGNFSQHEENTIINLHNVIGRKWALIAQFLPGRTDNEIKNHWNTRLEKQLVKKDIPPATQTPILQPLPAAADWSDSTAGHPSGYAMRRPSDAQLPNPQAQLHGLGFNSADPAQALPTTLPPRGPSFNYRAMEARTVYNWSDQFGPLITSIPYTGSISDLQVNNNYAAHVGSLFGTIPPNTPAEGIANLWSTSTDFEACLEFAGPELAMDGETSDSFWLDL